MEEQGNAAPAAVVENGSNSTQEVSSTTHPAEPTKRSLRIDTWRSFKAARVNIERNAIFNRIPVFTDYDKAALLLSQTDEFKNAQHIKVNIDRALNEVKIQTLLANKFLYLPCTRESSGLYLQVDVAPDATEEQKKEALRVQDINKFRKEITIENKVKLDMVVFGSVVVSREGHCIGRGNGYVDLDIGLLIELGVITPETVIVTLVHDLQVVDTLPANLFKKHDVPVDLIVTPQEIIRVANRLPRPSGIYWELLSQRRIKIVPSLQKIKENAENDGKVISIKDEDTDIEQNENTRRRGQMRRRFGGRRNTRRTTSQTDNEQQGVDNGQQKRTPGRNNKRFYNYRRRRQTKSDGDQSGPEGKSQDRKNEETGGGEQRKPRNRFNRNRASRDICVKLTNLTRDIRVKDLKSELRKRECNPISITWKGNFGKCFLYFGNRNGTPSTQDDVDKVLKSLNDLSLTINTSGGNDAAIGNEKPADTTSTQTKTINVNVELLKFNRKDENVGNVNNGVVNDSAGGDAGTTRIESVDTSTV